MLSHIILMYENAFHNHIIHSHTQSIFVQPPLEADVGLSTRDAKIETRIESTQGEEDKTFTMMITLSGRKRSPLSCLAVFTFVARESKVEITSNEIKVKITFSSESIKCADLIIACLTINSIYLDKKLQVCLIHSQSLYLSRVECNNRRQNLYWSSFSNHFPSQCFSRQK